MGLYEIIFSHIYGFVRLAFHQLYRVIMYAMEEGHKILAGYRLQPLIALREILNIFTTSSLKIQGCYSFYCYLIF